MIDTYVIFLFFPIYYFFPFIIYDEFNFLLHLLYCNNFDFYDEGNSNCKKLLLECYEKSLIYIYFIDSLTYKNKFLSMQYSALFQYILHYITV